MLRSAVKRLARRLGKVVVPLAQQYESQRHNTLHRLRTDIVFDVGANTGQYSAQLRADGYQGQIVSLEPLPEAFDALSRRFSHDPLWVGRQLAASRERSVARFNVSRDSVCSSLSTPTEQMTQIIPSSALERTIEVETAPLDEVWDAFRTRFERPHLKVDVQGFEREVLSGASELLAVCGSIEIELSLINTYDGSYSMTDALPELARMGFRVTSLNRGYGDPSTGQVVDVDLLLERAG